MRGPGAQGIALRARNLGLICKVADNATLLLTPPLTITGMLQAVSAFSIFLLSL